MDPSESMSNPSKAETGSGFGGSNKRKLSKSIKSFKKSVNGIFKKLRGFGKQNDDISDQNEIPNIASGSQFDIDMMTTLSTTTSTSEIGNSKTTLNTMHAVTFESSTSINTKGDKESQKEIPSLKKSKFNLEMETNETENRITPKVAFSIQTKNSLGNSMSETFQSEIYEDRSSTNKSGDNTRINSEKMLPLPVLRATLPNTEPHFAKLTVAARLKQRSKKESKVIRRIRRVSGNRNQSHANVRTVLVSTDDDIILGPFTSKKMQDLNLTQSSFNSRTPKQIQLNNKQQQVRNKVTQFPFANTSKFEEVELNYDDSDSVSVLDMDTEVRDLKKFVSSRTIGSQTVEHGLIYGPGQGKPMKYIYPRHTHYLPSFSTGLPSNERISIGVYMKRKNKRNF